MGSIGVLFFSVPYHSQFLSFSFFNLYFFSFSKCHRWSLESFHSDVKEPATTFPEQGQGKTTY